MKLAALSFAAALLCSPALAQQPPTAPPFSSLGGSATLSATATTGRTALPADTSAYPAATLFNSGTKDAYFKFGTSAVVVTTSPSGAASGKIPAGSFMTLWVGSGSTHIAVITGGSDTTTVELFQASGPLNFAH